MYKSIFLYLQLVGVLLFSNRLAAQTTSVSVTPQAQCANAAGVYTIDAGVFFPVPGANSYAWTIASSNGCWPTYTAGQHGGTINSALTASRVAITATCCGTFTLTIYPYALSGNTQILIPSGIASASFQIVCPYSPTVVASASTACEGQSITVAELGGNAPGNYNWIVNGTVLSTTASSIALTPSVNTCITFSPNSVQGCTNALISAACVSVQSSQLAFGNPSYTVCNNVPICLSLPVQTNTNVASGTSIPTITWLAANNSTLASPCMTAAIPGTYTALVSHTGGAGTCTRTSVVSIATGTALSVAVSPSMISVCNNNSIVPLSATSIQSVSSNYTWSIPNGTQAATTQTGDTIFGTANFTSGTTNVYTVNTSYFGCFGTNTIAIKPFLLNPSIIASTNSICLNSSVSLSANISSGSMANYNINFFGSGTITLNTAAPNIATVQPNFLPVTYTVSFDSLNCSALGTITIYKRPITPILKLSQDTICKNTALTLTCQNIGYLSSNGYTFGTLSPFNSTIGTALSTFSFVTHYPSVTTVYYVLADSSGCSNSLNTAATATVFIKPDLLLFPSLSSATICLGTTLNLNVTPGNNINWPVTYTWTQTSGTGSISTNINSQTIQAYPLTSSVYSVNVRDSLGCIGDTSISIAVVSCVDLIESNTTEEMVTIQPNPVNDFLQITVPQNALLKLFALNSSQTIEKDLLQGENDLDLTEAPKGCYVLQITLSEKVIYKKIIVY